MILFKLAIGLGCLACFLCLKRIVLAEGGPTRLFLPGAATMWLVSRLGLFVTAFVLFGLEVPSDVPSYYYPPGKMALEGKIAYRDFSSSYGPIFPYLAAVPVALWDSPKAIVLLSIVFEGAAILLWYGAARRTLPVRESQLGLLLYLCNPVPILNVAVAGQNQVWLSCFLSAAFGLFLARRELSSGFLIGLSVASVKVLSLLFVPYWWLMSRAKVRFSGGLLLALALGFLPFWLAGADVLHPLKLEGTQVSSGNLPFVLSLIGFNPSQPFSGLLLNLLLLVAIGALSLLLYKSSRQGDSARISLLGLTAILLVFMLLSKKSYTNYLNLLMLPLCCSAAVVLRRKWLYEGFLLWSCVAALEPSLWHRWLAQARLDDALHQMLQRGVLDLKLPMFLSVELLLLGGYGVLLWWILRHIFIGRQQRDVALCDPESFGA